MFETVGRYFNEFVLLSLKNIWLQPKTYLFGCYFNDSAVGVIKIASNCKRVALSKYFRPCPKTGCIFTPKNVLLVCCCGVCLVASWLIWGGLGWRVMPLLGLPEWCHDGAYLFFGGCFANRVLFVSIRAHTLYISSLKDT